ncbi:MULTISPECIES: NAD(P)/FAD-dependent oxidoreductase [unclassified Streptomyces]|uniref:NAD(P)/FAD-dependent oxidoreductase n=1 Tax=unclassified Streptomyces TaxID=2593676 RepID=UPI001BE77693|nr:MULTISPECIES: NAD(P)/FAD-dependent oxidoreductase [unclassified Streptomyces]MBT2407357.1 NAD(P)/FAD-dependent oxidoreductase [Streptomyces sp. ISL-21]MBT2455451.1 NAD(P)/FAD-dependent oxidoreductase [Streptomyces sp. ISL-86]MBT2611036.1 NAD(P)/FAD-dependent oxidoreductase [Streptomyces sp. ISL-87]
MDMADVVIVGGGAAGLAGAVTLARARRAVLVLDSGSPRNAPAAHMHGYLGHDGTSPADLLARGRAEAAGYGAVIRSGAAGTAIAADRLPDGGFLVRCADGSTVRAGRLLVATGLVDELPPVPGLRDRWGRDVLHCPYCHGWEVRDQPLAVLATGPVSVHQAQLWRQWSAHVTLLSHTWHLTEDDRELLAARGIAVAEGEVTGLAVAEDRLTGVVLAGGATVACQALVVAPRFTARSGVLTSLGLPTATVARNGHVIGTCVESDPATGATGLSGVWVAGNVTAPTETVAGAAAQGVRAAVALHSDLIEAETRRAVEARRARRAGLV